VLIGASPAPTVVSSGWSPARRPHCDLLQWVLAAEAPKLGRQRAPRGSVRAKEIRRMAAGGKELQASSSRAFPGSLDPITNGHLAIIARGPLPR